MKPLTNAELDALSREIAIRYGTRDGSTPPAEVLQSYTFGSLSVVWSADQTAEVRDANGAVVRTGTREECLAWAKSRCPQPGPARG